MDALIWICLTALAIALPLYYPRWNLQRALKRPLPPASLQVLRRNIAVYDRMPAELQQQLQRLVLQFLHQKKFVGCAGLEVDDEMAVTIAGQACMLLLNRPSKVYPSLHTILLYPSAFVAQRHDVGPGGVLTPIRKTMLGESWSDGRVVLSWDDVQAGANDWSDGHNVVLREFESLRFQAVHRMQSVMDHYGATNPAEFVAVATETYFEKPHQMAESHAELYAEFRKYYRVDPRDWQDAPPPPPPEIPAGFVNYAPMW